MLWLGIAAVLVFTSTQVLVPLTMRFAIDEALVAGGQAERSATWRRLSSRSLWLTTWRTLSGNDRYDVRTFALRFAKGHVRTFSGPLSFMDKTEVGRLMSRLQGDVSALQEFLETSIFAIGDFVCIAGIMVLLVLDPWLGLLTLCVVRSLPSCDWSDTLCTTLPSRTRSEFDS